MLKRDSSLQNSLFNYSRVQWLWALHQSSQHLALRMVILGLSASALPWKPISWSSQRSVSCVASRGSLELGSECCNWGRSRSVSLCGLPLFGWAVVNPRRFYFTITALTVNRGSSSRANIWRTDLLERWHPMTALCWKSLSSFYCQCLSMEISWLWAWFFTSVSNGCGCNRQIH
jgi:hypothetical protein